MTANITWVKTLTSVRLVGQPRRGTISPGSQNKEGDAFKHAQ
jgi:hypothetical protein